MSVDVVQESAARRPAPALRSFIDGYAGFAFSGLPAGTHRGLPSGKITCILTLGEPVDIVTMPGDQAPEAFDGLVGGLHTRPATIRHPGWGAGVSVDLSPLGCRSLFGMPAGELSSTVVDVRTLLGARGGELVDRLASASSWAQRFDAIDLVLTAVAQDRTVPSESVRRAWELLAASQGRVPVADLAASVGWSRRHLSARFRSEFGLSPKAAARVLRFQHAGDLLDLGLPLAQAATVGGYYDQAHLTNEWRELAGSTPTQWLADELRDRSVDELVTG